MRITAVIILLMLTPLQSYAKYAFPELKFQLENMDENETLAWCFKVAYNLSDYQEKLQSGEIQGQNEVFCDVPLIDSNLICGYLNKNHSTEHISDKQALQTIFHELEASHPCVE